MVALDPALAAGDSAAVAGGGAGRATCGGTSGAAAWAAGFCTTGDLAAGACVPGEGWLSANAFGAAEGTASLAAFLSGATMPVACAGIPADGAPDTETGGAGAAGETVCSGFFGFR